MKKLIYLFAIAVTAWMFQGCGDGTKNANGNADSSAAAIDTTISGDMNSSGMAAEPSDGDFATKAAVGGMAEVESGQLALTKASNAQVKDFAKMMVADHSKANEELKAIAKMKNISLPTSLDEEHQKKMDELNTKTGNDFDKAYVSAMVDDHKKTLKLMQDEAKDGKDTDLKAFAAKTAPVVQSHLDMITKIQDSMK
jgi:putative membrane protein